MRRRCLTLIEMIVASVLSAVILTTLLATYMALSRAHHRSDEVRKTTQSLMYLRQRLGRVLTAAPNDKEVTPLFYTVPSRGGGYELVFSYACGVDKQFGGQDVIGHLYWDDDERLWLTTWEHEIDADGERGCRQEVLMEGAIELHFSFLGQVQESREVTQRWVRDARWRYDTPPVMVWVEVETANIGTVTFVFDRKESSLGVLDL